MKDELTGKGIRQALMHQAWHQVMDEHDKVLIWSAIESGKSQQAAVARTLFELGQNPNLRFAIVSNTWKQAKKLGDVIRKYIEQSEELHQIFPHLEPGEPWGENGFSVRRPSRAKDPSVQVAGVHGNILGSRLDRLVLDDIMDHENARTPTSRKELKDWYKSTLAGRLTYGAKVRCIGTAWSPDDILHEFARQPDWYPLRYPVLDDSGNPRWPERWPMERIEAKRIELGPIEFRRQMLCEARDDASAKFKREWIEICLRLGNGRTLASALKTLPPGYRTYTGVDLAVQQHSAADLTVLFSIAIDPMGTRHVLEIRSGRWSGPEIVREVVDASRRYQSIVVIENNAAQDYIRQFTAGMAAVPMIPYTTGRNKAHPEFGVESLAVEMSNGKWVIPNRDGICHPEVQAWVDEMLYYDPAAHTGDRLMASFFAREGVRLGSIVVQSGRIDIMSR